MNSVVLLAVTSLPAAPSIVGSIPTYTCDLQIILHFGVLGLFHKGGLKM